MNKIDEKSNLLVNDPSTSKPIIDPNDINPLTGKPYEHVTEEHRKSLPKIDTSSVVYIPDSPSERIRLLGSRADFTKRSQYSEMARAQSSKEQIGKGIKLFFDNAKAGFLDALATYDLGQTASILSDVNEHYEEATTNVLTRESEKIRKRSAEKNKIYLEKPNKVNPSDLGWWMNDMVGGLGTTIGMFAENVISTALITYATGGLGTAFQLGRAGKTLLSGAKALTKAQKFKKNALTFIALNRFKESITESQHTGLEAYRDYIKKGFDDKTASVLASNVSKNTFSLQMPLLALDLLSFKTLSTFSKFKKVGKKAKASTKTKASKKDITSKSTDKLKETKKTKDILGASKIASFMAESLGEGGEELWQEFANEEAKYIVDRKTGLVKINDDRVKEYLTSSKAWNAFFLGVFGGLTLPLTGKALNRLTESESYKIGEVNIKRKDLKILHGQILDDIIKIEKANSKNPEQVENLKRKLIVDKTLMTLIQDKENNSTKGYDSTLEYLNEVLKAIEEGNEKEIEELGIGNKEEARNSIIGYIKDVKKVGEIYNKEKNNPNVTRIVENEFLLDLLKNEYIKTTESLKEIDSRYDELSDLGKEQVDGEINRIILKKQLLQLKEELKENYIENNEYDPTLLEFIEELESSLNKQTEKNKEIIESEEYTIEDRKKDKLTIDSLNLRERYLGLQNKRNIELQIKQTKKKLGLLRDQKVIEKSQEDQLDQIILNANTISELKDIEDSYILDEYRLKKLREKIKEISSKEDENKLEPDYYEKEEDYIKYKIEGFMFNNKDEESFDEDYLESNLLHLIKRMSKIREQTTGQSLSFKDFLNEFYTKKYLKSKKGKKLYEQLSNIWKKNKLPHFENIPRYKKYINPVDNKGNNSSEKKYREESKEDDEKLERKKSPVVDVKKGKAVKESDKDKQFKDTLIYSLKNLELPTSKNFVKGHIKDYISTSIEAGIEFSFKSYYNFLKENLVIYFDFNKLKTPLFKLYKEVVKEELYEKLDEEAIKEDIKNFIISAREKGFKPTINSYLNLLEDDNFLSPENKKIKDKITELFSEAQKELELEIRLKRKRLKDEINIGLSDALKRLKRFKIPENVVKNKHLWGDLKRAFHFMMEEDERLGIIETIKKIGLKPDVASLWDIFDLPEETFKDEKLINMLQKLLDIYLKNEKEEVKNAELKEETEDSEQPFTSEVKKDQPSVKEEIPSDKFETTDEEDSKSTEEISQNKLKLSKKIVSPNLKAGYISIKTDKKTNEDEPEIHINKIINSKKLLDYNKFKSGTKLTVVIPDNFESIEINVYDKKGRVVGKTTFGEWANTVEKGSDEYFDRIPLVAIDSEGEAVFFIHEPQWYNKSNVGKEDNPKEREELIKEARKIVREFRYSFKNKKEVGIIITSKSYGSTSKVKKGEPLITLNDNNPDTRVAIADKQHNLVYSNKGVPNGEKFSDFKLEHGLAYEVRKIDQERYLISKVYAPTLRELGEKSEKTIESINTVLRAFLYHKEESSNLILTNFKKLTGLNLTDIEVLEDYLTSYINVIKNMSFDPRNKKEIQNVLKGATKEFNEGQPFIFFNQGVLYYGKKLEEYPGGFLFVNQNSPQKAKENFLNFMFQSLPGFKMTVSSENLVKNKGVIYVSKDGEVKREEQTYEDFVKDRLQTNVKSFNINENTDKDPLYVTQVQPVIHFEEDNKKAVEEKIVEKEVLDESKSLEDKKVEKTFQKLESEDNKTKAEGKVFYMPSPNEEGSFDVRDSSISYVDSASMYKFQKTGDDTSEFWIEEKAKKLATTYPHSNIEPVAEPENDYDKSGNVITIKKGKAILKDGKWVVIEKAVIFYGDIEKYNKVKKRDFDEAVEEKSVKDKPIIEEKYDENSKYPDDFHLNLDSLKEEDLDEDDLEDLMGEIIRNLEDKDIFYEDTKDYREQFHAMEEEILEKQENIDRIFKRTKRKVLKDKKCK